MEVHCRFGEPKELQVPPPSIEPKINPPVPNMEPGNRSLATIRTLPSADETIEVTCSSVKMPKPELFQVAPLLVEICMSLGYTDPRNTTRPEAANLFPSAEAATNVQAWSGKPLLRLPVVPELVEVYTEPDALLPNGLTITPEHAATSLLPSLEMAIEFQFVIGALRLVQFVPKLEDL